ncbi:TPA: fimbrial protein, partial [Salmonella enterica subsp. enterica serovar Oranienburg]
AALASTVFSGAAMAWTAGGTGGNIEIGGNIQVTPYTTPWEVEVGAPANTLDANITKGTKVVMIPVTTSIPVLGIRTVSTTPFNGALGINPQIDYNGAVSIDGFNDGSTTMTLPLMDADNPTSQIGILNTSFYAGALSTWKRSADGASRKYSTYAATVGQAFWGGVAKNAAGAATGRNVVGELTAISPAYVANYNDQSATWANASTMTFLPVTDVVNTGVYGAGIKSGTNIKLTLTNPAANDVIKWKASLPVTVSYQ